MATRVVVDPVTRIEGHLRVEVIVDEKKQRVQDAVSSATMWRGIELILKGRDPRDAWAFTQRICGVCTTIHALASVRCIEDALGIQIPNNANAIRNIMLATLYAHDHVVHFYHLHALDWVSPVEALKADPVKTAELQNAIIKKYGAIRSLAQDFMGTSAYPRNFPKAVPSYYKAFQDKVKTLVESGQLGIFSPAKWWKHPDYRKLPPEVHLMAVAHYLDMLDLQREMVIPHVVFGGKNPHPHYLVGGMYAAISLEDMNAPINSARLAQVEHSLDRQWEAVNNFYLLDLLAIGDIYVNKHQWVFGGGLSKKRVLGFGDYPDTSYTGIQDGDYFRKLLFHSNGVVEDFAKGVNKAKYYPINEDELKNIAEYVQHSWFEYADGNDQALHPWQGETKPHYTGPKEGTRTNVKYLNEKGKYSWAKTPTWRNKVAEVGPLARFMVVYTAVKQGHIKPTWVDEMIVQQIDTVSKVLGAPPEVWMPTTVGRTAARGLEAQVAVSLNYYFMKQLINNIKQGDTTVANTEKFNPEVWDKTPYKGVGMTEAPRGALSHWVIINERKIENYQAIVPTTWNVSPRLDNSPERSAYEAAMMDTEVKVAEQPLEVLRTIHSFDPCLACSTHVYDATGQEKAVVHLGTNNVLP